MTVAALCIIGVIWIAVLELESDDETASRPTVIGTVVESSAGTQMGGEFTSSRVRVTVEYRYTVGEVEFTRTQEWLSNCDACRSAEETMERRYQSGAEIDVYYDPNNPGDGVINPKGGVGDWTLAAAIWLLIAAGVAAWGASTGKYCPFIESHSR